MAVNFDDLIPKQKAQGVSFDDLIPAVPSQGQMQPSPAAAVNPGLDGGTASSTVMNGGAAFGVYPRAFRQGAAPVPPEPVPPPATEPGFYPAPERGLLGQLADALGLNTLTPPDRARASNELAARRIARQQQVPIDSVYESVGGRRPVFNPEGRVLGRAIPEAAAVAADSLQRVGPSAVNAAARAIRGGDVLLADQGMLDRVITATTAPEKYTDPNYSSFSGLGDSLGYSLTTLVTSAMATAGAGLVTANPVVGLAAGMGTSGTVAYRASKDEFLSRVRENLNKQAAKLYGRGLDESEWKQALQDFDSAATQYGAWEAIPEALSNAIFLKAFSGPVRGAAGSRLTQLAQKAGALASEQGAETVTALGQNAAEREAGLTKEELDLVGAFRKQFLQTLMVSGTMAGATKGVQAANSFYRDVVQPQIDPASALGRAIQADLNAVAINPEATRQAAVRALNPDNAQLREAQRPTRLNFDDLIPQPAVAPAEEPPAETVVAPAPAAAPATPAAKPAIDLTSDQWFAIIGTPRGPARPDGPNEQISADDSKLVREMVIKIIKDGVTAGRSREQIVAQIEALTQGGISNSSMGMINELLLGNTPAPAAAPAAPAADTQRVSTVTGRQVETRMRVVDAGQLQAATGELQPRDRSRAASDEQINAIASQLDPQRLGQSAEADRGAPIVGPDLIVESGNGRVQGIRRAYAMFPERGQAYRQYLESQGYDLTGINEPVLVRERVTPLTDQERVAFVQEANQAATMDLTPVERAKIDVSAITDGVLEVWAGGDVTDAGNRDFVRGFISQLPQAQRNGMLDDNGALAPDGAQRIRRALLAAAYEDRDLLVKLIESADDNIKSIGNALFDSAGPWLQMKRMAQSGAIDPSYNVTADLVQAARVVDQLRQSKGRVQEWLAQNDLTSERNLVVDAFVTAFYNEGLSRAVGREAIADVLRAYVDMAKSQTSDGLFGAPPAPAEMVQGAVEQRNERNRQPTSGNLFGAADADAQPQRDASAGSSVQPGGRQARDRVVQGGGTRPDGGGQAGSDGRAQARGPAPVEDLVGAGAKTEEGVTRGADRNTQADAPADRGNEARAQGNRTDQNQRVKGTAGDPFIAASFTNRQSIYRDAFVELGYDPAEAELLPPERQFNILAEGLKKTYGLALVQKSDRANLRVTIDQLLDAYRGLQLMAHVLDLPTSAIGLGGKLALGLVKDAGYLGAHYPLGTGSGASSGGIATNTQTIVMPGRSNSFAHEWGHALDFYLASTHGDALANLSDYLREGESLSDKFPETTGGAFRHLLNAIFFDQAEQSAKIMELERKIEEATQAGKDTNKLQTDLDKLRSGASKSRNDRSQFYRSAGEFAKATGSDPDYWRKPTEMLARSFEAYIAHKVEAAGGTTEFIGKGDAAYQSDAHIRFAKTFPKDADRYNIFRAYDLLFDAIRSDALLNPSDDAVAGMPAGVRLSDPAVYFDDQIQSAQSQEGKGVWEAEKRAWRVRARELERQGQRPSDPRPLMKRMGDAVRAAFVTNRGVLLAMEQHYAKTGNQAAAKAIRALTERIATDPGSGRKTFEGGTYAEAVERETRRFMTRLSNIRNAADADLMSDADLARLTDVLTAIGDEASASAGTPVNRLGAQLRELLTDLYYYNKNAGLDIGFVKDQGYLPRLLDEPLVTANAGEFIKDATEVYKIVFERDTERPMDADEILIALQALDKRADEAGIDRKRDPELDAYREARKELAKLLRALNGIDPADPDSADKIDKAQAALNEFLNQNGLVFEEAYDYVRDQWSAQAAAEYQTRISYGSPESFSSHSPAGSYLKERTLPPEADKLLAKYYIQDPIERVTNYLQMSVRKAEYNLRFGRNANGREKNTKLFGILESMVSAGVRREDRDMAEAIVGQVTGTRRDNTPSEYQRFLGNSHALGQMVLLGRVVLTSLAEPMTTAVQTGKPLDALKAIALTVQEILATKSVKERRAMARTLGIVAGDYADEMIANRLGGSFAESTKLTKASANYFRRVGLTGLTNAQRRAAMHLSGRYVLELAHTLDNDQASAKDKGFARAEMIEAGIQESQIDAFVKWSREYSNRMPRYDELIDVDGSLTDMGKIYGVMVGRLVNQAIQSPSAIDRPWAANTPTGRLTYGLLSFSMAFFRNVMVKSVKKIEREYNDRGAAQAASVAAAQVIAPIASLYMGHLLVTMLRELILNPDKWEEEEKKEGGFPIKWLSALAFSRSGFTGLADPLYNAYVGVKYQRDLTALFAGATYGYAASAVERIIKYFSVNSDKTNSAERNAARGLYELTFQPGLAYATGALPGGPVVGYGLGASYMYMTSPAFKSQWQDWIAGEKENKQKKAGSGQQEDRL